MAERMSTSEVASLRNLSRGRGGEQPDPTLVLAEQVGRVADTLGLIHREILGVDGHRNVFERLVEMVERVANS